MLQFWISSQEMLVKMRSHSRNGTVTLFFEEGQNSHS
jgi:hypothetical protein